MCVSASASRRLSRQVSTFGLSTETRTHFRLVALTLSSWTGPETNQSWLIKPMLVLEPGTTNAGCSSAALPPSTSFRGHSGVVGLGDSWISQNYSDSHIVLLFLFWW